MRQLSIYSAILVLAGVLPFMSCISVPFEFTLEEIMEITEEAMTDARQEIFDQLKVVANDPTPDASLLVNQADCEKAFEKWLQKQFATGFLPARLISSLEYGASEFSNAPHLNECKNVDLRLEYIKSQAKSAQTQKGNLDGQIISMSDHRKALEENPCSKRFIDPKNEKVRIDAIEVNVLENNLSIITPSFKLYHARNTITKTELENPGDRQALIDNKDLKYFGETKEIPPRYTGRLVADFSGDKTEFRDAQAAITSLESNIIAWPEPFPDTPVTQKIGDQDFYVLPQGGLQMVISLKLSLIASLSDARCALEDYKERVKKAAEARRRQNP